MFFSSRKRQKVSKERKRGKLFPEKFIKGFACYPKGYTPELRAGNFDETPSERFNAPTQSRSNLWVACVYKWQSLWFVFSQKKEEAYSLFGSFSRGERQAPACSGIAVLYILFVFPQKSEEANCLFGSFSR